MLKECLREFGVEPPNARLTSIEEPVGSKDAQAIL
jgi:hypothetical protein